MKTLFLQALREAADLFIGLASVILLVAAAFLLMGGL